MKSMSHKVTELSNENQTFKSYFEKFNKSIVSIQSRQQNSTEQLEYESLKENQKAI